MIRYGFIISLLSSFMHVLTFCAKFKIVLAIYLLIGLKIAFPSQEE